MKENELPIYSYNYMYKEYLDDNNLIDIERAMILEENRKKKEKIN